MLKSMILESISLLNGGKNYDLLAPPNIELSGSGVNNTNALIQPVISGKVVDVQVDPQDFDIKKIISITMEGGTGSEQCLNLFFKKEQEN